jgi:hypothetical protein
MKNSNTSLNDLFRSAQSEAEKDVLSQSEVERLLQSAKRSVPVTQSIQQQLYQRLLSAPLKIGMTAMTTAACITLGLIAFWPQTSTQPVNKAPISPNVAYSSPGSNGATHLLAIAPTANPPIIFHNTPITEALPVTSKIPATPIATADSLQPVELSPDQLAKLGIVLEDNGDIDFYTKSSISGSVNKFGLPPTWGVRLYLGQKISEADIAQLTIPKSAPRLVTEPNGAKRLFSFESDSSYTNNDGGNKVMVQMHNSLNISPNTLDSSPHVFLNRTITKTIEDSNPSTDSKSVKINSHSPTSIEVGVNKSIPPGFSVGTIYPISKANPNGKITEEVAPGQDVRIIVNSDSNEIAGSKNSLSQLQQVDSLQENKDLKVIVKIFGDSCASKGTKFDLSLDSSSDSKPGSIKFHGNRVVIGDDASGAMSGLMSASSALHNADSVLTHIESELNSETDTTAKMKLLSAKAEYEMAVKVLQNTANSFAKNNIKTADSADRVDFWAREAAVGNSIKLGNLIPIRIRNLKNAAHPNELIFWYEPTPELTSSLPSAVNSNPPPQSKQLAISVYPNPTLGPATIHYELADAPKAYFSVRNLLGQEVLNGGVTSGTTGDAQLDLSQLPAGVYLLVTTTDNGERDVERVVVTK